MYHFEAFVFIGVSIYMSMAEKALDAAKDIGGEEVGHKRLTQSSTQLRKIVEQSIESSLEGIKNGFNQIREKNISIKS